MRMQTVMFEGRCFSMLKTALKSKPRSQCLAGTGSLGSQLWPLLPAKWHYQCTHSSSLVERIPRSQHLPALYCWVRGGELHMLSSVAYTQLSLSIYFRGPLEFFIHFTWAKSLWKDGFATQHSSPSLSPQRQEHVFVDLLLTCEGKAHSPSYSHFVFFFPLSDPIPSLPSVPNKQASTCNWKFSDSSKGSLRAWGQALTTLGSHEKGLIYTNFHVRFIIY